MAITSYNTAPYFDDYNIKDKAGKSVGDKNYLRILFQPGFAVQTRELNQLQSILQGQIDRLGGTFYREGEAVLDAESTFRDNVQYIEISLPTDVKQSIADADIKLQETLEIRTPGIGGGQYAKLLGTQLLPDNRLRLYVNPVTTIHDSPAAPLSGFVPNGATIHYKNDKQVLDDAGTVADNTNTIGTIENNGYGFTLNVQEGIFYVKGSFVHTPGLTRFWIKNSRTDIVRGDACLTITEKIVTSAQDSTLLDNSTGSYNYAAPGADRYAIDLDIAFFEKPDPVTNSYPLQNIDNQGSNIYSFGSTQTFSIARIFSVTEKTIEVIENREQSNLEKRLARRTYEESGNYTVNPFKIAFREFAKKPDELTDNPANTYNPTEDPLYTETEIAAEQPFGVTTVKDSKGKFIIQVEPSTAYVNGFRYQFPEKTTLAIDKARTAKVEENVDLSLGVGNFFDITLPDSPRYYIGATTGVGHEPAAGVSGTYSTGSLHSINTINAGYLNAQASPGPVLENGFGAESRVGFNGAIVKSLQYISDTGATTDSTNSPRATYRVYLNNKATFQDVLRAFPNFYGKAGLAATQNGQTVIDTLGTIQASNAFSLKNHSNNAMLFELPQFGVQRVYEVEYEKYKKYGPTTLISTDFVSDADASKRAAITIGTSSSEPFTGTSANDKFDYTIIRRVVVDGGATVDRVINPENYQIESASSTSITFAAVPGQDSPLFFNSPLSGDQFIIQAPVKVTAGISNVRTKTKTAGEMTVASQNFTAGTTITLKDADVITSTIDGANGNLKGSFEVIDNGLNDPEFYQRPTIRLTSDVDFTGVNTIQYTYYTHGTGDFFCANSYGDYTLNSPLFPYDSIQAFRNKSLANYLDFRCKETYTDTRGGSNKGPVALIPNRNAKVKYSYFLPRKDRLIINGDGEIDVVKGEPSVNPILPPEPANSMTLYTYFVPGWTSRARDINAKYIDNQRSTMKDLGRLRKRVADVEYYSALSVLENNAMQKNLLNSDGTQKFKNGIIVDNFRRDKSANAADPSYLAATDKTNGILRPFYSSNNLRLYYSYPAATDPANTSGATDFDTNENRIDKATDYYVDNDNNKLDFDKIEQKSIPASGRPNQLSVTGFQTGGDSNTLTNGSYQLYNPNTDGYPEYRRIDQVSQDLSKASRRIVRVPSPNESVPSRWEVQTLSSDSSKYETEYYTKESGTSGNDAPYPTNITVTWFDLQETEQTGASIKNSLLDRAQELLPDSTSALQRDRFLSDGANNGEMLSLWNGAKEVLFEQPNASRTVTVQPYELSKYVGKVKLSPNGDEWVDTKRVPASVVQDNTLFQVIEFFANNTDILDDHLGMQWQHWEQLSQGTETLSDVTEQGNFAGGNRQRTIVTETTTEGIASGVFKSLETSDAINESHGDKVVDINIVPFIRSRDIAIYATGLQPNSRIYAFFDGKDVTRYVAATEGFREYGYHESAVVYDNQPAPNSTVSGGAFQSSEVNAYEVPLYTTSETGEFFGTFRIPNNDDMRFRTGLREFKLTSSKSNKDADADCFAKTNYNAYGINKVVEETIVSTQIPEIVDTQVSEFRTIVTQNTEVRQWTSDPIAQTFTIPTDYTNGVCVTDVDVFFAEKPNFPVNVEVYLVPTEQGIPTNVVVPGSRVSLPQSQVRVPENGRDETDPTKILPTNFRFDYPIYLKSGVEYAMIVFSPSPLYRVWIAELGGANVMNAQRPITKNSGIGVLLKSQNKKTWTPDQTKDLMFTLNKGIFLTSRTFTFNTKASSNVTQTGTGFASTTETRAQRLGIDRGAGLRNLKVSSFNIASDTLEVPGTSVRYNVNFQSQVGGNVTKSTYGIPDVCQAKKTYELKQEIDSVGISNGPVDNVNVQATLTTRDRGDGFSDITPMIDLNRHSLLLFQNHVEPRAYDAHSTSNGTISFQQAKNDIRGYVTKNVVLTNAASNLRIFAATNRLAEGAELEVYVKARGIGSDTPWNDKNWDRANLAGVIGDEISSSSNVSPKLPINVNQESYTEAEFNYSPTAAILGPGSSTDITEYAVKIAFTGDGDSAKIVRVKDLRVIANS